MTDDVKALVERLRNPSNIDSWRLRTEAVAALTRLGDAHGMLQADFNDCNSERARWKARAEKAEAALVDAALDYERQRDEKFEAEDRAEKAEAEVKGCREYLRNYDNAIASRDKRIAELEAGLRWYAGDGSTYDGIDVGQRARALLLEAPMTETDVAALVAELLASKANGDPERYIASISVAKAHMIAAALTRLGEQLAESREVNNRLADRGTLLSLKDANDRAEKAEAALLDTQERLRIQRDLTDVTAARAEKAEADLTEIQAASWYGRSIARDRRIAELEAECEMNHALHEELAKRDKRIAELEVSLKETLAVACRNELGGYIKRARALLGGSHD